MLWLKAFHLVFMVTWFAGLFYLPRLFVYHATALQKAPPETGIASTFNTMQRKLMIMTHIGGSLTWIFGLLLLMQLPHLMNQPWLQIKLGLVLLLLVFHIWCLLLVRRFAAGRNQHSQRWYRWFNEVPSLILVAVVLLAIFKPFQS